MDEVTLLKIMEKRETLKGYGAPEGVSDQAAKLPQPPMHSYKEYIKTIPLPKDFESCIKNNNLFDVMNSRTSKRSYTDESLSLTELSWLLWITQGEKNVIGKNNKASMRTVPSAGARHPLEQYIFVNRVNGLESGLYHYISDEHKLGLMRTGDGLKDEITCAFCGQTFFAGAAVCFIWTVVPYRTEWRYVLQGQKFALLDVGHVCENLYLAAASVGCGACAVGAYYQYEADNLLGLDGSESFDSDQEFVVYAAGVGKVNE